MRVAVGQLGLAKRVVVEEGRLEADDTREFNHAMSRATFAPGMWLEHGVNIAEHVWALLGDAPPPMHDEADQLVSHSYTTLHDTPRAVVLYKRR